MDFDSREHYRKRVAFIAAHSDCTESQVAPAVLELAREGLVKPKDDRRMQLRSVHVGYYLIDKGFPRLVARIGFNPPPIERIRALNLLIVEATHAIAGRAVCPLGARNKAPRKFLGR